MREIEQQLGSADAEQFEQLMAEYERLHAHFEVGGGYDIEHRTEEVLVGLGFAEEHSTTPVHQLSGGQKTRVALAKALLADPDLLLLDEPTNHLDLTMLEWLEDFLRTWSGACLIVSHDRYFLDRVTTRTLDLAFGRLEDYPAPYARYLKLRAERRDRRLKEYEEQQEFIARTEEFIRKYKAGQRAREAKGRQTRLDRLERIERPQEHQELAIQHPVHASQRHAGADVAPLTVGYRTPDGATSCCSRRRSCRSSAATGSAWSGRTAPARRRCCKTLVGELPPLKGEFEFGTNVKVGYYAQAHEQLPPGGTPLTVLLGAQAMGEESARSYLGRFLFTDDDVYKPVAGLSGGERSRLALAVLLLQNANFLVLDEPTNHLDITARETLEEMLGRVRRHDPLRLPRPLLHRPHRDQDLGMSRTASSRSTSATTPTSSARSVTGRRRRRPNRSRRRSPSRQRSRRSAAAAGRTAGRRRASRRSSATLPGSRASSTS